MCTRDRSRRGISSGLSRCADLEDDSNTANNGGTQFLSKLVLSNETPQPKPLESRIPVVHENGPEDRESASVSRWGVFVWPRGTKGPLYNIIFLSYINSPRGRACAPRPRRLPAPALHAHSGQPNVTKARTNGRPKRTGAHLRAMKPTRPAARRGPPGGTGFCPSS